MMRRNTFIPNIKHRSNDGHLPIVTEHIRFFDSVLRPFQSYFSSYETGQSVGGAKPGEPLTHPQAELGLSHMWPEPGLEPTPDTAVR